MLKPTQEQETEVSEPKQDPEPQLQEVSESSVEPEPRLSSESESEDKQQSDLDQQANFPTTPPLPSVQSTDELEVEAKADFDLNTGTESASELHTSSVEDLESVTASELRTESELNFTQKSPKLPVDSVVIDEPASSPTVYESVENTSLEPNTTSQEDDQLEDTSKLEVQLQDTTHKFHSLPESDFSSPHDLIASKTTQHVDQKSESIAESKLNLDHASASPLDGQPELLTDDQLELPTS